MATARMTLGAALGTINDTATAISSVVTTISDGVGMLHDYTRDARRKQQLRMIGDEDDYINRLTEDRAKENAQRREDINNWASANPEREKYYLEELDRLKKLYTEKLQTK